MQATRRARIESVIQEELAFVVSKELKDPRIPSITFTSVELTEDAAQATLFITILGGTKHQDNGPPLTDEAAKLRMKECLEGLRSASGFLRRHLGKILTVRHIPT